MPYTKFLSQELIGRVVDADKVNRLVAARALNIHHGRFDEAVRSLAPSGKILDSERRVVVQSRGGGFLSIIRPSHRRRCSTANDNNYGRLDEAVGSSARVRGGQR